MTDGEGAWKVSWKAMHIEVVRTSGVEGSGRGRTRKAGQAKFGEL